MRIDVPNVPDVPPLQLMGLVPSIDDVLERAAFLEFCEGLDRLSADCQALHEFGFDSWDALAHSDEQALAALLTLEKYAHDLV
jgi:hypothetical protein